MYDIRKFRMSKDELIAEIAQELRLLQRSFDAFDEAAAVRLGLNRTDLRCLDIVLARGPLAAGSSAPRCD